MKKTKEKSAKKRRRGLTLVVILAAAILLVNLITASYSWFSPASLSGVGMKFQQSDYIRSEECSIKVYEGKSTATGAIEYGTELTKAFTVAKAADASDPTNGLKYFRVRIENADTVNASNVSLYLEWDIPAGTTIGVVSPSNSVHTYSSATSNAFLVRNAYVSARDTSKVGAGTLDVDFFIRNSTTKVEFNPGVVKILYN